MDQLYQQLILDHARQKAGYGLSGDLGDAWTGESFQVNPTCGDEVRLRVRLDETGSSVAEVSWEGVGCSISQASTSVLTGLVSGADTGEVDRLHTLFGDLMRSRGAGLDDAGTDALGDAVAFEGVSKYPARVKCALLGWMALQDALIKARHTAPTEGE